MNLNALPLTRSLAVAAIFFMTTPTLAASPGYLYVADTDTARTTEASVMLPINNELISNSPEHTLFEMSMSNQSGATGNIIEIGVTTDLGLNGDRNPHWFVSSWINGNWQGYDSDSDFISQSGSFWNQSLQSVEQTQASVEFSYTNSNWWLYLNGVAAGYFAGSEWGGAFTSSSVTDVYGEVYQDGTYNPTMDGTVSGYNSSANGRLRTLRVDAPYHQYNASSTGFTAEGPGVPEPASGLIFATALLTLSRSRRTTISPQAI